MTLTVRFTPEQLRARGIAVDDLTLFWYDEDSKRWLPVPTTVDAAAQQASADHPLQRLAAERR